MRLLKRIIIFCGIIFLALLFLSAALFFYVKHIKIKDLVEKEIESSLGISVSIEKLEFSPLLTHIGAGGVTIYNPTGFDEKELAYISSIHLVFDPLEAVTRSKPNIYLLTLDLKRLNIIKNKEGKVNLKELLPLRGAGVPADNENPFYFDVLVLSVGEINYTDYTQVPAKPKKYIIGLENKAFVNLKDEDEVIKLIVQAAIENTDIGKLINLTIVPVVTQVSDTMNSAWGTAKLGLKSLGEVAGLPFKLIFGQ